MPIYIDTHAACWLYMGTREKFSPRAIDELERHFLLISPMVGLELQYLYEIKRLKVQAGDILNVLRKDFRIRQCDAEFTLVCRQACAFNWTRDPFDRMIVAQAALSNAPLLTRDINIRSNYAPAFWD